MKTEIISTVGKPDAGTSRGAEIIRNGGLVAFPTETVYGLGANGFDGEAVKTIFEAKGRPSDNPLILHVAKKSDVRALWDRVPDTARRLMDAFWPGPLTIICKRHPRVPDEVTAGLDTVAVRMPLDRTARMLIEKAGVPIAAPSANLSGKPSPTTAQDVFTDMDGRIPLILDGGACKYGVESTVISLVGKPTILRPGAATKEMLEAVIGPVEVAGSILSPMKAGEVAASPGMKYKHYAPNAEVIVVTGEARNAAARIKAMYREYEAEGKSVSIAATEETKKFYNSEKYVILGSRIHSETLCANLFRELRELDTESDVILAEGIPPESYGLAFMNRLLRSAGFHVVNADDV